MAYGTATVQQYGNKHLRSVQTSRLPSGEPLFLVLALQLLELGKLKNKIRRIIPIVLRFHDMCVTFYVCSRWVVEYYALYFSSVGLPFRQNGAHRLNAKYLCFLYRDASAHRHASESPRMRPAKLCRHPRRSANCIAKECYSCMRMATQF